VSGACFDDDLLTAYVGATLATAQRAAAEIHLDGCPRCRSLLVTWARAFASRGPNATDGEVRLLPKGTQIGRYELVGAIGAGAMGVVYEARDPQLNRRIAVKLMRADAAGTSPAVLREGQAMASVQHPNVVAVFDMGEFRGGRYVAMELVEGQTLREWLAGPRTTREIIELFSQAGDGLAAVHAAGLVHRDFKPDNVLVGSDGRARVTDFGLAGEVGATADGRHAVGTPGYAAPEQEGGGAPDARADQYGFCAALREALGSRAPRHALQVISRGTQLRPHDRYASMNELLLALRRDPRRALARVAAAAALGAALAVTFTLARRPGAEPCRASEARLAGIWDEARRDQLAVALSQAGGAEEWGRAQRIIGAWADRWVHGRTEACLATRVRGEQSDQLLSLRELCLDQRLRHLQALEELFLHPDPKTVRYAADAARALPDVRSCSDLQALAAAAPVPPQLQQRLAELTALRDTAHLQGGLERAQALIADAHALSVGRVEAQARVLEGDLLRKTGRFTDAYPALSTAAQIALANGDDASLADALSQLVLVTATDLKRPTEAETWGRLASGAVARARDSLLDAQLQRALGALALKEGDLPVAEQHLGRALEIAQRELGDDYPRTGEAHLDLARVHNARRDFDRGRDELLRAVEIFQRTRGPMHPQLGLAENNLGWVYLKRREYPTAREHLERALAILTGSLPPEHPNVATCLANLGYTRGELGDETKARELLGRARELSAKSSPAEAASVDVDLAELLVDLGHPEEAGRIAAAAQLLIDDPAVQLHALRVEGDALAALGRTAAARERYALARQKVTALPGKETNSEVVALKGSEQRLSSPSRP
jgi:tetratricopeptide (TPR) repeat protein